MSLADAYFRSLKAISEAQTLSGKRAILDCLTVLIDRVGDKVSRITLSPTLLPSKLSESANSL